MIASESTDFMISARPPKPHCFQQVRSLSKTGKNSLGDVLSYMISNRLTVAYVIAENLSEGSLSSDMTEIKIEAGMKDFELLERREFAEDRLSA